MAKKECFGIMNETVKTKFAIVKILGNRKILFMTDVINEGIDKGYCRGWDYSAIGFAYIPKDSKEVRNYRRSHTAEETKKWAEEILEGEIHTLDQWCRGEVYGCVTEEYDTELEQWDNWSGDSCWGYYLGNDEEKDAINIIKEFSGNNELLDEDVVLQAIEEGNLDVLQGQQLIVFEFDVPAESTVKEIA